MKHAPGGALAVVLLALAFPLAGRGGRPVGEGARRPVALAVADGLVFVANRGGTVSVIDAAGSRVAGEVRAGRRLSDLAVSAGGKRLLATDEEAGELIVLRRGGRSLEVVQRLPVPASPAGVRVAVDGGSAFVTSLWPRRLTVVALSGPARVVKEVPLPFAPRALCVLPGGDVLVADAFGGRLVVVDPARGEVIASHVLPGHNLRGLALDPGGESVLVAQQILHPHGRSTLDDIHWGNLLTNNVRRLSLSALHSKSGDVLQGGERMQLDETGRGAGDPAAGAVGPGGTLVVPLAGVDEVAVGPARDGTWQRLAVGAGPSAIAVDAPAGRAFVANTFADSVSVIDLRARRVITEVALGPRTEAITAGRGERLFHDARLSHDGWLSCASCHPRGHTTGQLNDNLSDGSLGTPKRILSLLGTKDTGPWAWNGKMPDLETQVRQSVLSTMQGRPPTDAEVRDVAAYLRTLPPPPTPPSDAAAVARGRAVFEARGCVQCHAPPAYTSAKAYDVGLGDEAGGRQFNPPSLRGVGHAAGFFHDSRAATLDDVLGRFRHQLAEPLPQRERDDLLAFLRSL